MHKRATGPAVSFYIPRDRLPPAEVGRAWANGKRFTLQSEGPAATEQAWVYQTYLRLRESGYACRLVHEIPKSGILVAFVKSFDTVPMLLRGDVFFVCVVADTFFHPFANWYVVQNPRQTRRVRNSTFLAHWPQPFLQPRDPARGDTFENVCYYGHTNNLAPELCAARWHDRLREETGLRFSVRDAEHWHDYRMTDAVVAVRSFEQTAFLRKPATKLYNAWLAGVPALCGRESALRAERRTQYDYLEVGSPDELIQKLRFLKDHPAVVTKMRENAARRAKAHTAEAVREQWQRFLTTVIPPKYEHWQQAGPLRRKAFYLYQQARDMKRKAWRKSRRHISRLFG